MLTPEQLSELPYSVIKLYRKLEDYILADIARRIAKAGYITDTAEWQTLRLKELGEATDNIKKEIARITKLSQAEVNSLFFDAAQISTEFDNEIYRAQGLSPIPLAENDNLLQLLEAGIKQTNQQFSNFTQSLGFAVDVGEETVFKPIAKVYQDALDFAQFQVSSGAVDYITAVRMATKKLADSGIRFVDYKTGWVNRADVAVRRAVLTGIGQTCGKITETNADDMGCDLVEVTAHSGARPEHAVWQGKIFSRSGKSKKYPDFVSSTHYGEGNGLKGWNCRHDFFPYFEGMPRAYSNEDLKNIDPPPVTYEGKIYTHYEATQYQRKIETTMRKTKREIISADASGDKDMFSAYSIKLKRQRELYSDFSAKAKLPTQLERTQVLDFDRSKAQKAVQTAKKAVDNKTESGIMKSEGVAYLEQAKKRDSKVIITDQAIEKIPQIKINDFSDTQDVLLQQKHKELLKIAKDRNDSNEVLKICNSTFETDITVLGDEFGVLPSNSPNAVALIRNGEQNSLIFLHNHPSTNNFSVADIDTFVSERTIKIITAVTNQGEVHILNKNSNYTYDNARRILKDSLDELLQSENYSDENLVKMFLKSCKKGGIDYEKSK